MQHHSWDRIEEERMNALVSRRVIHYQTMTVARIRMRKGAMVPLHHHPNEQVTMLESGKLRFAIGSEEKIIVAGESIQVPPDAPHLVEALEDSLATDVFSPVREDWIRGDDAYLR